MTIDTRILNGPTSTMVGALGDVSVNLQSTFLTLQDEDSYFAQLVNDAMAGDSEAQAQAQQYFGDNDPTQDVYEGNAASVVNNAAGSFGEEYMQHVGRKQWDEILRMAEQVNGTSNETVKDVLRDTMKYTEQNMNRAITFGRGFGMGMAVAETLFSMKEIYYSSDPVSTATAKGMGAMAALLTTAAVGAVVLAPVLTVGWAFAGASVIGALVGMVVESNAAAYIQDIRNGLALAKSYAEAVADAAGNAMQQFDDFLGKAGQDAKDALLDLGGWAKENMDGIARGIALLPPWLGGGGGPPTPWSDAKNAISPLVLDLDNDGVELYSLDNSLARFDLDQDGFAELTAWVAPDDGLLAIDLNENGKIDNIGELFGSSTIDGFTILSGYDTNSDGLIDQNDAAFSSLLVWRDLNSDGESSAGELFTLSEMNIKNISLSAVVEQTSMVIAGNDVSHTSIFTFNDNSTSAIVDVWFQNDQVNTIFVGDYELDTDAFTLPVLRGYGELPDLHIAISMDNAATGNIKGLVQSLVALDLQNLFSAGADSLITDILYRWAGVDGVDPESRGEHANAQQLGFMEALFGEGYLQGGHWSNPTGLHASSLLNDLWDQVFGVLKTHLIAQTAVSGIFAPGNISYNLITGEFDGTLALDQTFITTTLSVAAGNAIDGAEFWEKVAEFLQFVKDPTVTERGWLDQAVYDSGVSGLSNWGDVLALFDPVYGEDWTGTTGADSHTGTSIADIQHGDAGDDILYGNSGNDDLHGGDGNDVLYGDAGDDVIYGDNGNDTLYGGDGNDILYATGAGQQSITTDSLDGGAGSDMLYGDKGNQTYYYSGGDDGIIDTGGVSDAIIITDNTIGASDISFLRTPDNTMEIIIGTLGSIFIEKQFYSTNNAIETLQFTKSGETTVDLLNLNDVIMQGSNLRDVVDGVSSSLGGNQNDIMYGYGGNDDLDGGVGNDIIYGGDDNDSLEGNNGNDQLYGDAGNDLLEGFADDDMLDGGTGNDTLKGGMGNDTLYGGAGNDYLYGEDGVDELHGDAGNDYLNGGINNDTLYGDDGNDLIYGDGGADVISGGTGTDTLNGDGGNDVIHGDDESDIVNGNAGDDTLYGDAGDDTLKGGAGNDSLDGGAGTDTIDYSAAAAGVTVNLSTGSASADGDGGSDTISNVENITGSAYANSITGSSADNVLSGGAGNDTINGGAGNDTLRGGTGNDTLDGSTGTDTVDYSTAASAVTVSLATGTATGDGTDTLSNFENITGSANSDTLTGNILANIIDGGDGNDTIRGGSGNDILYGGDGDDFLYGENQDDTMYGGLGSDTLDGGGQNNTLIDVLGDFAIADPTGDGYDIFKGAMSNDTIIVNSGDNNIQPKSGNDLIKIYFHGATIAGTTNTITGSNLGTDTLLLANVDYLDTSWSMSHDNGAMTITFTGTATSSTILIAEEYTIGGAYNISNDTMSGSSLETLKFADNITIDLFAQSYVFKGTSSPDTLTGTSADEYFYAFQGNDTIYAGDGNDYAISGTGSDIVYAGAGDDIVYALADADTLYGEDGNDYLNGGLGNDIIYGGAGHDNLFGEGGDDILSGGSGNDWLFGQGGNDTYIYSGGIDYYSDNANFDYGGADTVIITGGVTANDISFVDLGLHVKIIINSGTDEITIQNLDWTNADFTVDYVTFDDGFLSALRNHATWNFGTSGADSITGGSAHDTIIGKDGNDIIDGAAGDDDIHGGNGDDTLIGGAGNDLLHGGEGTDTVSYISATASVTVNLSSGAATGDGTDTLMSIENIIGSVQVDTLTGDGSANRLEGGAGNDTLTGAVGNDSLYGGDGNDTLYGDGGDDLLYGGDGLDSLTGGANADAFIFEAASAFNNIDSVVDFSTDQSDKLNISDILDGFYTYGTDDITQFVQITDNGTDSMLAIDQNGGGDSFVSIAMILGITGLTDEAALETSGALITH